MMAGETSAFGGRSYEFAVGSIKASSHPPLTKEQWSRLNEADYDNAVKLVAEYGYPQVGEGQTIFDAINAEKERMTEFIMSLSPDIELTRAMLFEEDALNIKLFYKAKLIGRAIEELKVTEGSLSAEMLRICIEAEDFSLLGEQLDKELSTIFEIKDAGKASRIVDRAIFANALRVAKSKHCKPLETFFEVYGEGRNRVTALRLRNLGYDIREYEDAFLPTKENALRSSDETSSEIEILADVSDRLSGVLTELGYESGMGPIAEYYFIKKNEAAALRLMFAEKSLEAKTGGVSE